MQGAFEYERAATVEESCRLLAEAESAVPYAGGTDLLVDIRNGRRSPSLLVDIKGIEALRRLDAGDADGGIIIGPAVTLHDLSEHKGLQTRLAGLVEAARSVATFQLRNRATIGGNVCNASPAADLIPPLLVIGALLEIQGPERMRKIALDDFCTGVKQTCLAAGELVTKIRIPPIDAKIRTAFLKQQRIRGHDLAIVNLAGAISPGDGLLHLAVGSCGPTPIRLAPIETRGHATAAVAQEAVRVAGGAVAPISDVRASAAYREAVLPALTRRLVARLLSGKGGA